MSLLAEEVNLHNDVDDVITWNDCDNGAPQFGKQLSPEQRGDLDKVKTVKDLANLHIISLLPNVHNYLSN